MYRIIGGRSSGKTMNLMLLAKETGSAIVCSNPAAMRAKSHAYGLTGIDFISYEDLMSGECENTNVMIDEIEEFIKSNVECKLTGYSLSNED